MEKIDDNSKPMIADINEHKKNIVETLNLLEESKEVNSLKNKLHENKCEINKKHKEFLDKTFEMLINQPYPVSRFNYWKYFNSEGYKTEFEALKKLKTMSKYKIPSYMKEHNMTEFDLGLSSMNLKKKQFDFVKNVFIYKELEIKKRYEDGIRHLLKAKEIFEENSCQLTGMIYLFFKCQIISEKQLANSKVFKENILESDDAFNNIWNIKVKPKKYEIKFSADP